MPCLYQIHTTNIKFYLKLNRISITKQHGIINVLYLVNKSSTSTFTFL